MKKGYFFTLDAFIAMSLLAICVVMVFSIQSSKPYPMQSIFLSDDLMQVLSSTKLYELQNSYYLSLYKSGVITSPDSTILEQIAWFFISGRPGLATNFTTNITASMIPDRYGFELRIYNETSDYLVTVNTGQTSQEDSRLIITSKRLIMGMENNTAWSPMMAEVRLWQ